MHYKTLDESSKESNSNSFAKFFNNKEVILDNILENDNYINNLRINPNNPLKGFFTTGNIKILIRYCIKFDHNSYKESERENKIIHNLCQLLCSPCVLLFKQSIHNIKHSNNIFYRYKNAQKNNTIKKEEYAENETITLRTIKFNS